MMYNIPMLTKKYLHEKGYAATEIADQIFLIEDFLSEEDRLELLKLGEDATQEDWEGAYLDNMKNFCEAKFGRRDIENLVAEGKLELTTNWNDKILRINGLEVTQKINDSIVSLFSGIDGIGSQSSVGIIQRQYEGVALTEHVDNHTDPSLVYALVAYVNDNYNGGEVFFSKFGISMKPKAGTLLAFPTTEQWTHGVTEVEAGPVRYVLPIFISRDGFYKENKY
jgi:hypothetical protein